MYRQRTNKDCGITVVAHATGLPYTSIINQIPAFRFLRARRRIGRERADKIVGRRQNFRTRSQPFDARKIEQDDREYRLAFYNQIYRVNRFPYFCHFGLSDSDYKPILEACGFRTVRKIGCTIDDLRNIKFALLSVPSINVKTSAHLLIWRDGRIWDPSPLKRYNFARLRCAKGITCMPLCRDQAEYDSARRLLGVDLTGAEIMVRLIWKGLDIIERGVDPKTIDRSTIVDWFKIPRQPSEIETRVLESLSRL